MSNSRASSDNNNVMSELDEKAGAPVPITNKSEECEKMFRHRDAIYTAELSLLSGEPIYSQSEVDARVEKLFNAVEG